MSSKQLLQSLLGGCFLFFGVIVPAVAGNRVVAWGDNSYGQTNVPPSATNVLAIAAGATYSLALKDDGTVIAWGQAGRTNVPAGLTNVVAIAAGGGQSLALKNDGTLVAWGVPYTPSITNIPAGLSNIVAIACGDAHNLVLRADGTVYAWGANYSDQTNIPSNLTNVVAIVAGNSGNFAIRQDGTVWSLNTRASNITANVSNAVAGALVNQGFQGAVVLGSGLARAWGYPNGTNVVVVSNVVAAVGYSPFNQAGPVTMLRRDRTLTWISSSSQSNNFMNLSNVLAVAMSAHYMAIVGDSFPGPAGVISAAGFQSGQFMVSQPTSLGRTYRLEYKDSLNDNWQTFPPVPGNGSNQILADPFPSPTQRFYQVRIGQ